MAAAGLGCEVRPPPPAAPAPRPPPRRRRPSSAPALAPAGPPGPDRGCSEEAAQGARLGKTARVRARAGRKSRLPRPGRCCVGNPGGGRSPTAHGGAEGRVAGAGAGRSRCSAGQPQTWKKLSLEALFPRGAVVVPSSPGPCRVGLTGHRPQLHLRPGLHFCGWCRGGEDWRGGGRGVREHHIWGG